MAHSPPPSSARFSSSRLLASSVEWIEEQMSEKFAAEAQKRELLRRRKAAAAAAAATAAELDSAPLWEFSWCGTIVIALCILFLLVSVIATPILISRSLIREEVASSSNNKKPPASDVFSSSESLSSAGGRGLAGEDASTAAFSPASAQQSKPTGTGGENDPITSISASLVSDQELREFYEKLAGAFRTTPGFLAANPGAVNTFGVNALMFAAAEVIQTMNAEPVCCHLSHTQRGNRHAKPATINASGSREGRPVPRGGAGHGRQPQVAHPRRRRESQRLGLHRVNLRRTHK